MNLALFVRVNSIMSKAKSRREVIRLLGIAGFSVYLPSCWNESTEVKDTSTNIANDSLPQDSIPPEVIEPTYNHVRFFTPSDSDYQNLNIGFNLRVPKHPAIIALCENTEGVAEAVQYAKLHNLKIAIKSGGHSFESFSSNDGGMQINLSLLKDIEVLDSNEVRIGPGVLLRELYDKLLPLNRIVPAGSCGTVGVGGLALGGGYGFFARKYGLTCDNMLEATMVDGEGEIHTVTDGKALMWALKGGGNGNFGVVTEMKFKSHAAPKGFTRHRFKAYKLTPERAKSLLKTWFECAQNLSESAFSAFVLNGKTLVLLITHYEDVDDSIQRMIDAFTPITDKKSIGTVRPLAKSLKTYYGIEHPIPFKNASAGYYKAYEDIEGCLDAVFERTMANRLIYQINTLGGNIATPDFEEKSSYPHRNLPFLSELQSYWEKGQNPDRKLKAFKEVQDLFYNHGIRTQYRNYPDIEFKDWETAYYGEENYPKLQEIKKQFDPNNRFEHPQSVKV